MALKKLKLKNPSPDALKEIGKASDYKPKLSSALSVYDIPLDRIHGSEDNPNEQDDRTFDQLVERIRKDGFDEPIHVIPDIENAGKYTIVSGHHRAKAARVVGMESLPCIIHNDWDEQKRKIELVARNNLRGTTNPEKFTKLYNDLVRAGLDKEIIKVQMGFTKRDAFEKVYKSIEKALPAQEKKKLKEAKENIRSVDDLSSIINNIFKNHGDSLDAGFTIFSYGGRNHHYIKIDKETDGLLSRLEKKYENGGLEDALKEILKKEKLPTLVKKKKVKDA